MLNSFRCCFVEIYKERVRDLLAAESPAATPAGGSRGKGMPPPTAASARCRVRDDPQSGPFVDGCVWADVCGLSDLQRVLQRGMAQRATASTDMNPTSSRSHAIFTVELTQTEMGREEAEAEAEAETEAEAERNADEGGEGMQYSHTVVSKINLVDLAGSESPKLANTANERLREGSLINQSLLTLGRVIALLSAPALMQATM